MPVMVRIPTPLRSITKGSAEVQAKGETVQAVMQDLERQYPGLRERLNRVFAERTGQPVERIEEDTRRNFWLDAEAAREYGLVGRIIQNARDIT